MTDVLPAPPLTRGATVVREQLLAFYRARLPIALAASRVAWGLTLEDLPNPVRYSAYEPLAIDDRIPLLAVAVARSNRYTRLDEGEYQARYFCTVYGWLKADEYEPPQRIRDDYADVLTSLLLDTPSLGAGGGTRFEETTLEVNYSDAAKVKGDRWLTGVSLAFQVVHTENLRRVELGTVEQATVEATVLVETIEGLTHVVHDGV